ncbi:MATE efflux family protein [Nemania sp. FL0916]|nr:MATE efflux family protein [Nemania sp. FL0916]
MGSPLRPKESSERLPPSESTPLLTSPSTQQPSFSPTSKATYTEEYRWASELWLLLQYSVPLIFTYLLQYSWSVIVTYVAGHLSADDLAAASVGMTTMAITGYAIFEGMATALDTLCSQSYGAGHLTGVGLHVQRMLLFMLLVAVVIGGIWGASPQILTLFVKQEQLAVLAGRFLRINILGIPGYASFEAIKRFLQAQGDFKVALVILIICTPLNAVFSSLFAFKLGMGLEGAAWGVVVTNTLRTVLLLLYIVSPAGRKSYKCWGGFSRAAWSKWGPMVKLSVAGSAVNLAEWGSFQIVGFSTSYLSTTHLAAQSVLTTISVIVWHIPFSVSIGISTRVGQLVGAGMLSTVRHATALYLAVFTFIGCLNGIILFAFRRPILQFFLEDSTGPVYDLAAATALIVCVYQVIDAVICFTNGMLRGLGRQSVAACIVIVVNYCAAVPFAVWLELGPSGLKLNGAWVGLGSGMIVIAIIECCYLKLLNWQRCVERAQ